MIRGRVLTIPGGITVRWPDQYDDDERRAMQTEAARVAYAAKTPTRLCSQCCGTGTRGRQPCRLCHGAGVVR